MLFADTLIYYSKEEQERRIAEKLRMNGYTEDEIVKKMEEIKKELENPVL